jgi:CIC family chloride channel protein
MAAVFSGAAQAPITAVIILFELSGDYRIILPLMIAVALSMLVSEALSKDTIYTLKLRRRGIDLRAGRDTDLMRVVPVAQAMSAHVPTASSEFTIPEAMAILDRDSERARLVVGARGQLEAIVTLKDLERAVLDNNPGLTLGQVATRPVTTVTANEPLSRAVHTMGMRDVGQVPVVARSDPGHVIGLLRRSDVVRAYSQAMLTRIESQTHKPALPSDLRDTRIVEVPVESGGVLDGRTVAQLQLPPETLVVTVQRGDATIIPRGETPLRADDRLQILVRQDEIDSLHEHLASLSTPSHPTT